MNRRQRRAAPPSVDARFDDALGHHQAGRLAEAETGYRNILAAAPRHADSLHLFGVVAHQTLRHDLAATMISRAIAINPRVAAYHSNLGNVLRDQGKLDRGKLEQAAACFRAGVRLEPGAAYIHNNLGNALMDLGLLDEAAACFRQAIRLAPELAEPHNNLGNTLRDQGALDEAASCLRAALALRPDYPEAHNNLGNVLRDRGLLDDAIACYHRAIAFRADFSDAHFHLGMALLARGDLLGGWPEYEWRWQTPQMAKSRRDFPAIPQWRGEPAPGKLLLIHAEQGFGDTIQFCRYATLAAARGLRVILEVQKPLLRLLENSLPEVDRVIAPGDVFFADTKIDFLCPMLSLPLALGTTLETIFAPRTPYLRADPKSIAGWENRLAGGPKKRVGLVWAGDPRRYSHHLAAIDRRRSIAPEVLAPLFEVPGLSFISLQKHGPPAPGHFPLIDVMAEMDDFYDTAALIMTLDLVIAVDTAVAHLAAALGKPVWLLDRFDHCWRWLAGRRDSPWYPTLRLYRQQRLGDWDSVLAEVAGDLRGLTA